MRPYHKPLAQRRAEALARIVRAASTAPNWATIIAGPYRRNENKGV